MPTFQVKSDLPKATQDELDRILAIAAANRTTQEANFLTARAQYENNRILRYSTSGNSTPNSSSDLIIEAEGDTVPSGYTGFRKGAIFYDLDKTGMNIYINVGDGETLELGESDRDITSP